MASSDVNQNLNCSCGVFGFLSCTMVDLKDQAIDTRLKSEIVEVYLMLAFTVVGLVFGSKAKFYDCLPLFLLGNMGNANMSVLPFLVCVF